MPRAALPVVALALCSCLLLTCNSSPSGPVANTAVPTVTPTPTPAPLAVLSVSITPNPATAQASANPSFPLFVQLSIVTTENAGLAATWSGATIFYPPGFTRTNVDIPGGQSIPPPFPSIPARGSMTIPDRWFFAEELRGRRGTFRYVMRATDLNGNTVTAETTVDVVL
jgi:hypothetical protein